VVAAANAAINQALKEKTVIDSLALMGLAAQGSTPAEMDKSQKDEHTRWGPLVRKIGFTADS
jgi:tripartite-type tricarboxylate transporter receptor subunit TctC